MLLPRKGSIMYAVRPAKLTWPTGGVGSRRYFFNRGRTDSILMTIKSSRPHVDSALIENSGRARSESRGCIGFERRRTVLECTVFVLKDFRSIHINPQF